MMKKVIFAMDSFKGTLTARQACQIIAEESARFFPDAEIIQLPIADGGEGLVDALLGTLDGELVWVDTVDPLGRPMRTSYAMLPDGSALIEMAAAGGLTLVEENKRNPENTSTYGVGLMILDAVHRGADPILIGLGGSATVDGGVGAATALGMLFENGVGEAIHTAARLAEIEKIEHSAFDKLALDEKILFLSDVNNPLCGANGAAAVFGPQKGATQEQVRRLDMGLLHLARRIEDETGLDLVDFEGIGAAGGFALPFVAFAKAKIVSGINFVLDSIKFDEVLAGADLIISGEGRTDAQSAMGKAISAVAQRASQAGVRVAVISGLLGEGAETMYALGVSDMVQATPPDLELADALINAESNLRNAARSFFERIDNSNI